MIYKPENISKRSILRIWVIRDNRAKDKHFVAISLSSEIDFKTVVFLRIYDTKSRGHVTDKSR